ncbi:hypothetical protein ABT095_32155 [Kitasatospora sp. NPDC002227]|uniref:hypothetical protein n=1 Tax=Kitasatospora sp. NPDC002227 TaxID=3154773 RepID=UPI003316F6EF
MSATLVAGDDDPYRLPAPTPDSPVVLDRWISPDNHHPNSRYRDEVWSLAPLIDNPATSLVSIHWKNSPAEVHDQLKMIAWATINGELRPSYLRTRAVAARSRMGAAELVMTCHEWMIMAQWLVERGIRSLSDCSSDDYTAYAAHRGSDATRTYMERVLGRLTDLWAYDQLTAHPAGVPQPPLGSRGFGRLPARRAGRQRGGERN